MDIQSLISIVGLVAGLTYVLGGLIVNLHLARFGITEYQILRVKYLVVGLTYLTNAGALLLLAGLPALIFTAAPLLTLQIVLAVSLLASLGLLWLWGKALKPAKQTVFRAWLAWLVMGSLAAVFPLAVSIRLGLSAQVTLDTSILIAQAVLAGVLAFISQIYYFARYLYGRPSATFGSVDPIGMGIPVNVQLAGDAAALSLLKNMGVPCTQPNLTDRVLLLDETDTHYILGIPIKADVRALKVNKDIVKAILYIE